MSDLIVVYYEKETPREELLDVATAIQKATEKRVLALPKDYDLLLNVSLDQLVGIKALIDTAVSMKLQEQGMVPSPAVRDNIVSIEDYLPDDVEDDGTPKRGEIINMSDYLS